VNASKFIPIDGSTGGRYESAHERKAVGELTWGPYDLENEIRSKAKLPDNDNGKRTGNPLVPLGHGIYPEAHLISTRTRFDTERMVGP
jgi:hypothetical protein